MLGKSKMKTITRITARTETKLSQELAGTMREILVLKILKFLNMFTIISWCYLKINFEYCIEDLSIRSLYQLLLPHTLKLNPPCKLPHNCTKIHCKYCKWNWKESLPVLKQNHWWCMCKLLAFCFATSELLISFANGPFTGI